MNHKHVVLSIFGSEPAAGAAVEGLKDWNKVSRRVRLNAIGVLTLDEHGDAKIRKLGSRSTRKGAGIGLALAVIAPPVGLGAVLAGGALGALHHKNLGMSEDDMDRMSTELASGKAAVGVLARSQEEAEAVADKLHEWGGASEIHALGDDWIDHAAAGPPPPPITG